METTSFEQLIHDTLYGRRISTNTGCFVVNTAGLELLSKPPSALPEIEACLIGIVVPGVTSSSKERFLGLDYLLGAYLTIGSKSDPTRIVEFLKTLPLELQAEAAAVMPIWFGQYQPRLSPPDLFVDFVRDSCNSGNELLREKAIRAMSFLKSRWQL